MEGESQAGGEDLEARRIEGTEETAKTEKASLCANISETLPTR
jgi:hypothetical protein